MNGDKEHTNGQPVDEAALDSVIDAVAREMTEGEPSAALRARVLEQIERIRRRSLPLVPRWAWAGAAAVVTLAVLTAVWMSRPLPIPSGAQAIIARQQAGGPATATAGPGRQESRASAVAAEQATSARRFAETARASRVASARTTQAEAAEDRHPVPALATIEPLRFTAVEPEPLQFADVDVTPLPTMSAIEIPGLGPDASDLQSADPNKEK